MIRYVIKRLLFLIPVLLGVVLIVFFFQAVAPGDVVDTLMPDATEEQKEVLRDEMGLNDPIAVQYGRYVWELVTQGNLGTSHRTGSSVSKEVLSRYPITVLLAFGSVVISVALGIPLGILSAVKQYTWFDSFILAFSVLLASVPSFWLALMLISLFSVNLHLLPSAGITDPKGWILPIAVVAIHSMANLIRTTRSSMLETIRQDYIQTARAKGQTEAKITINHVLRNSLIPIVSTIGNTIGVQLGGAIVIETVFGMPGIGKYAYDAISARNYPAVLGSVVVLAFTFTVVNLLIDLLYVAINPMMKTRFSAGSAKKPRLKAQKQGGL